MKKFTKIVLLMLCCLFVITGVSFAEWQNVGTNHVEGMQATLYLDDDIQDCGDHCIVRLKADVDGMPLLGKCKVIATIAYKLNSVGNHKEVDISRSQSLDTVFYNAAGEALPLLSEHRQYDEHDANAWNSSDRDKEGITKGDVDIDSYVKQYYDKKYNSIFSGNNIIYILLGIFAFIVIVAAANKSKKKNEYYENDTTAVTPNVPQAAPVTVQESASPRQTELILRGEKGCFQGMTMPIHRFPSKIGRDTTQCKVQFPEGTEGVSRVHCTINNSNDGYTVVDSSTYGTFVNGQKIAANTPVRINNGDYIALGSSQQILRVTIR